MSGGADAVPNPGVGPLPSTASGAGTAARDPTPCRNDTSHALFHAASTAQISRHPDEPPGSAK